MVVPVGLGYTGPLQALFQTGFKKLVDIAVQHAITVAFLDAGAQILVVEQDFPTPGMTVLECAKISIDRLKEVMHEY